MNQRERPPKKLSRQGSGKKIDRAITLVCPVQGGGKKALMPVATVLDNLSAEALALLRFASFTCGHCGGRVSLRVQSVDASGTTSGHRAYFAHAVDEGTTCPAVTPARPCVNDLGAAIFCGKQEGARHRQLKDLLLVAASVDPEVSFSQAEVHLTNGSASRRPDVVLGIGHQLICFDIQVAPPPRVTISARTAFYEPAGFKHVWIIDGAALGCVNLQPFQDLLWRQGGRALAFNVECLDKSLSCKTLALKLVTLSDEGHRISTLSRWVQGADLLASFGLSPTTTGTGGDFLSLALLDALSSSDRDELQRWYMAVGSDLGLPDWDAFMDDGLRPLLGALASILAGEVRDGSARRPTEVTAVVHNALTTGLSDRRHLWVPIIASVINRCAEIPNVPGFSAKTEAMIDRARQAHDPVEFIRRIDRWRPLLTRLFPTLLP